MFVKCVFHDSVVYLASTSASASFVGAKTVYVASAEERTSARSAACTRATRELSSGVAMANSAIEASWATAKEAAQERNKLARLNFIVMMIVNKKEEFLSDKRRIKTKKLCRRNVVKDFRQCK